MFHRFTKFYFEGAVKWKFRQVKTLFPLKDKSLHPSCVIYKRTSSCGETYIGETLQNASIRGRKTMTLLTSQILLNT